MAWVVANVGLDLDLIDLNFYQREFIDSSFQNNVDLEYEGVTYRDVYAVRAGDGSVGDLVLFGGGANIQVDDENVPVSGTLNIIGESMIGGNDLWVATGISVSIVAIRDAMATPGTADELALLVAALQGNDRILLSSDADDVSGFDGNDLIRGRGGNDSLDGGSGRDTVEAGNGNDRVTGGGGADWLAGDAGRDTLSGGTGDDTLFGGSGRDRLVVGDDTDAVRYAGAADGGDVVVSFGETDLFHFEKEGFGSLATGTLSQGRFQSRPDIVAQDPGDRFLFRTTDDSLWFDPDGNGASAPVLIATLASDFALAASDILIV
jgi:Ca2+-binding RTX toxin-like protein